MPAMRVLPHGLLALVLLSAACADPPLAPRGSGTLTIQLTDAPGDIQAAVVTIAQVYLQGSGGRTILRDLPFTVDLVPLATTSTVLLEDVQVAAGTYHDLRFVVTGAYLAVEEADGSTRLYASAPDYNALPPGVTVDGELRLPSFATSGLKVKLPDGGLPVPASGVVTLVVDFDVAQSFGHAAGESGAWVMHPVIQATSVTVAGVTFTSVTAGSFHTCGLTPAGAAYCWGENGNGQLGDGTLAPRLAPVMVAQPGGLTFTNVTAGSFHTCGLTPARAAYCWGLNVDGRLGDGTTTDRVTPVPVAQPAGVTFTSVTAGSFHTCGRTPAGAATCWGDNSRGQLGDGTRTNRVTPVAVAQPAGVTFTSVTAGSFHTCGLTPMGAATCWGDNSLGQLGDGTTTNPVTPVAVAQPAGVTFTSVTAGELHTCGLTPAGAAYCWGGNGGQLGDGTTTDRLTPVAVAQPAGVTFTSVTAGAFHTCGRTPAGATTCWGVNSRGQLGDGTTTNRVTPVPVAQPAGVTFTSVTAGAFHTCGRTPAGAAYCWGDNSSGQLGDGTTTDGLTPVAVALP